MQIILITALILAILLIGCYGCVRTLRRRPGLRRNKRNDKTYTGPQRRMTDDLHLSGSQCADDVMMSSTQRSTADDK